MDCWSCQYVKSIPGDAQARCKHPKVTERMNDRFGEILSLLGKRLGPQVELSSAEVLGITLNEHGVRHNWANWPFNFDPIWVNTCNGYFPEET